jgi:hypothetical protein
VRARSSRKQQKDGTQRLPEDEEEVFHLSAGETELSSVLEGSRWGLLGAAILRSETTKGTHPVKEIKPSGPGRAREGNAPDHQLLFARINSPPRRPVVAPAK